MSREASQVSSIDTSRHISDSLRTRPCISILIVVLINLSASSDPEGYLSARQALGLADQTFRVLVVEDSPTGILAGQAAGCRVLGLATTYSAARVQATGTVWTVRDLESVKLIDKEEDDSAKFALRISGSLVPQ